MRLPGARRRPTAILATHMGGVELKCLHTVKCTYGKGTHRAVTVITGTCTASGTRKREAGHRRIKGARQVGDADAVVQGAPTVAAAPRVDDTARMAATRLLASS